MMRPTTLTYRDYEALPDDGRRYEIHDGELSVTPAPTPHHQMISGALFLALSQWLQAHSGGRLIYSPLDVILADTTIVQPDIVYLAPDRLERISHRGIEGAPTLAVEVLSPSTWRVDRITKRDLYARYGVPCLWLVDPDARAIETFTLEHDHYVHARTVSGSNAGELPPFTGLALVPDSLWC
jgi:Uma2 family endonuclease